MPETIQPTEPEVIAPKVPRSTWWRRLRQSRFLFVSVAIHLLFGAVATIYVVQNYQGNRKLTFKAGPPSPNRATRAIEHKVQMAKQKSISIAPPAVKRIVSTGISKVTLPQMPAMPTSQAAPGKMSAVSGTGFGVASAMNAGTGSSGGGGPVSLFGLREASHASLVGTFYDLKQNMNHRSTDMNGNKYADLLTDFVRKGWNEGALGNFYRAPQPLYAGQIMIPQIEADEGPKAFGVEKAVQPRLWVVLYKARVSPPESGTYHFVGAGDDVMFVRFDKKNVLERGYTLRPRLAKTDAEYPYSFSGVPGGFAKGEGVAADAGTYYDMSVLIGEQPGGKFFADLLVEKEGATYEKDSRGNPILPRFRVSNIGPPTGDKDKLPPFMPNGPVWRAEMPGH
ncbi:MAG: hypothetical protein H0X40_00710 [Chthoniobacterales bacterium]|nr:hypothetical protein [Chthoniobacterales bacterium]